MLTMILDNDIKNIGIYDKSGVDRIFIDLELNGKEKRQGHLDTVISKHSFDDIKRVKSTIKYSQLLVRINPIYENSRYEIDRAIDNGADIVMLPMFKSVEEVQTFIEFVSKRIRTSLLLETSEALARIDDILEIDGIDEIHIGLNDLHLALGLDFMFELLGGDLIEYIVQKIKAKNIPFGIGGVARMDEGMLQGSIIIKEHVRLGSSMVILSRTFKNGIENNTEIIKQEIQKLQDVETRAKELDKSELLENKKMLHTIANNIAYMIRNKK